MRILFLLCGVIALVVPGATWAACDGPAPSFRLAAASATTVVVGTVVETHDTIAVGPFAGYSSSFNLRVDHVLRGNAPPSMEIADMPMHCAGPILAQEGNVIAVAVDARMFGA